VWSFRVERKECSVCGWFGIYAEAVGMEAALRIVRFICDRADCDEVLSKVNVIEDVCGYL